MSKKKKGTKKDQKRRIARTLILISAILVVGFSVTALLWGTKRENIVRISILPEAEDAAIPDEASSTDPADMDGAAVEKEEEQINSFAPEAEAEEELEIGKGNVLVIIDDVGYNLHQLLPFLSIPGPVTFAVLPGVPYTKKAAEIIDEAGKTSIIHQPMQAVSQQNLGEKPILMEMDEKQIVAVLEQNIGENPYALGMNNHMGSMLTTDAEKMEIIMKFLKQNRMIFIDSLTTSDSAVKKTAEKLGMPYLQRHVFLDNEETEEYYTSAFYNGVKKAGEDGLVVLIGHVWADGLAETLQELYKEADQNGVKFISINELEETVIRYAGIGD